MNPRIEDILDRCIEAACAGRDPETILQQHPELADEVRPLLEIAAGLEALPAPSASSRKMMTAMAKAFSQQAKSGAQAGRSKFFLARHPVLARAAAILLVVLIVGWGTVNASSSAIPGDILYRVKMLAERVRYSLTVNPEGEAELLIAFSDERLREAVRKHQQGGGIDVRLLGEMLDHARHALEKGFDMDDSGRDILIQRVTGLHHVQKRCLEQLKASAGPQEKQVIVPFLEVCTSRCSCLEHMGGSCECCVRSEPSADVLREWMEKFPPTPQSE